ncbi:MAG: SGNH/GDSL hydrolase family protein [Desulfomonile tiedjei]|uniref:SGNH/GDSL hydrolase family protein n=1 Tax=Desulfomonile tiedjei TaxID=2358 RepID=A0A9D6V181_9BACT|nr:SGNH/GDSL hydrolase family protein [Desulfomonile tiedjei]
MDSRDIRFGSLIAKVVGVACTLLLSLALFLVLYANTYRGYLILLVVIAANVGILFVPARGQAVRGALSYAKSAALCLVSLLATLLVMEVLFPALLPLEYSQVRDLSQRTQNSLSSKSGAASRVYNNSEQKRPSRSLCAEGTGPDSSGWHEPYKKFEYFGYDPNERFTYLNIVCWNSEGYFDDDHLREKPTGVYRIVFIGDSYVEAIQVPLAAAFHKLLEAHLNLGAQSSPGQALRFEVIALGNSGAGQRENLNVLKTLATLYHPDMVVITLCSNDFCDDDPVLNQERVLFLGQVAPVLRGLLRHNYLLPAFVVRRYAEFRQSRIAVSPELLQWSADDLPQIELAWARSLSLIRESRDYCAARGIQFALTYLGSELEVKHLIDREATIAALKSMGPGHHGINWDPKRSVERTARFCEDNRIAFISLVDSLAGAQKESGKLVFWDHYTIFGHEIAAQNLQKRLGPK